MPIALLTTPSEWTAVTLAYLLGSVPFGLLLGFAVKRTDIRKFGSGNIGATNVGRVLGRSWALVAFALDFGKGWLPTFWIAPALISEGAAVAPLAVLCGAAAVCGHIWPVFLRFRGGKGVATASGAIVAIDPIVFLGGGVLWLVTLALTRFVGLSSIVMGIAFPLVAWWRMGGEHYGMEVILGTGALTLLILIRHLANIRRMVAGTEPKIGGKRDTGRE
jgi:acyl phosphate:glycerol-3-phosphate acyltransferase